MFSISFILVCLVSKSNQLVETNIVQPVGPFASYSEAVVYERGGHKPIFNEQGECKILKSEISTHKSKTLAKN